jgi:hypothetical protein
MAGMDQPWFAAKRFGIGSGRPIAWQGWVVTALFMAGAFAAFRFAPERLKIGLVIILIVAFSVVAAAKTRGGWRWRWGRED